jgi:biotin carboxyl carrier protein
MKIFAEIKDKVISFEQQNQNGTHILRENNKTQRYSFTHLGLNRYSLIHNNRSHLVHIIYENNIYHVHLDGEYFPIRVEDERSRMLRQLVQKAAQQTGEQKIAAPIPGLIKLLRIKEGDQVKSGDGLFILEAMKMENEIRSETNGIIKKVFVEEGAPVNQDQIILIIESQS